MGNLVMGHDYILFQEGKERAQPGQKEKTKSALPGNLTRERPRYCKSKTGDGGAASLACHIKSGEGLSSPVPESNNFFYPQKGENRNPVTPRSVEASRKKRSGWVGVPW